MLCCILCVLFLLGCGEKEEVILIGGGKENGPGEDVRNRQNGESPGDGTASEEGGTVGGGLQNGQEPEEEREMRIYVCGAVKNPGVVTLPAGSRGEDALLAAGGFREDAGRDAVNLADWLEDGQMLYFPTEEEAAEQKGNRPDGGEEDAEGLVNINTADAARLCTLPGIGESRAADIIAYREKNGRFQSCEDIMQVPGIKAGAYEKIRDKITVK